jgi:hypothetical protein
MNHLTLQPPCTIFNHDGMGKKFDFCGLNGPHLNYHGSCLCGYLFDLIIFLLLSLFLIKPFFPSLYFCHHFFQMSSNPLDLSPCNYTSLNVTIPHFLTFFIICKCGRRFLEPHRKVQNITYL